MNDHLRLCAEPGCRNAKTEPRCAIHRRGSNGHDATDTATEGATQMNDDMNRIIRGAAAHNQARVAQALGLQPTEADTPLGQARDQARQAIEDYRQAPEGPEREKASGYLDVALDRVRELRQRRTPRRPLTSAGVCASHSRRRRRLWDR